MEMFIQSMEAVWWAAVIVTLLLFAADAFLDSLDEDRDYKAMHSRMTAAICIMAIGFVAKIAKLIA